jgi:putative ABC transport system permease protein
MNLFQDFRYGLRALRKKPAFALTAILTLALGIGANIAVFSIVNALILRPYPFPELDRIVLLRAAGPKVVSDIKIAPADFLDLQRDSSIFQGLAAYRGNESNLTGAGEAQTVVTATVSPNFFDLLGAQPVFGRRFTVEDGENGRDAVVILNYTFWQKRFNGDKNVVGQTIEVDGRKLAIIGVMPSEVRYPEATDLWMPLALTPDLRAQRNADAVPPPAFRVLARLQPGISLAQAGSELQPFSARLQQQFPDTHRDRSLTLLLLRKGQYSFSGPLFLTLQVAALFVLLLATANLFNLLFARLVDRQKELAIRTALGASRMRLLQLFIGETVSLAIMAGIIALICSKFVVSLIRTRIPQDYTKWIAGWESIRVDSTVTIFAAVLIVAVGLLFALGAAWHSSASDVNRVLKQHNRGAGSRRGFFRSSLVVAQVAFAAVLLVGAGLMVQGFFRLANVYKTFDPGSALSMKVRLPEQHYKDDAAIRSFYQQFLQRVSALPGVQFAGVVTNPPASNVNSGRSLFTMEGQTVLRESEAPSADVQSVSADFFRSLRIPVLQGRSVSNQDGADSPRVAVISRTMAARFWPDRAPIGQRIKIGPPASTASWTTIVGVVEDVKQNWWDGEPRPVIYRSYLQEPRRAMNLVVRTSLDSHGIASPLRDAGRSLDSDISFASLTTMESEVSDSLAPIRILGILMVVFGAVSIALSALGIYGLLAHSVAQRTHEFGVRMALGAQRQDVLRLVIGQSWKLALIGLALGLPAAYLLVRAMASTLYGVIAPNVTVFVVLSIALILVAVVAGYLPARRATGVDPMLALRYE